MRPPIMGSVGTFHANYGRLKYALVPNYPPIMGRVGVSLSSMRRPIMGSVGVCLNYVSAHYGQRGRLAEQLCVCPLYAVLNYVSSRF